MTHGSIENPESIVLEVVDFFLMDIGTPGFTSTSYSESGASLAEYQMDNMETLMADGVRMGYAHSHHSMSTFYSGEDDDDMVVNTKDKDMDYYVTMIMNNRGEFIARLAFRVDEKVNVNRTLSADAYKKSDWTSSNEYMRQSLIQLPLTVIQEGVEEKRYKMLKDENDAKAKKAAAASANDKKWYSSSSGSAQKAFNSRGSELFPQEDDVDFEDLKQDTLMGQLMVGSLTYRKGLDAAVKAFNKTCSAPDGTPYDQLVVLCAENILSNARTIIVNAEGNAVTTEYVNEVLSDLISELITNYVDVEIGTEDAVLPECQAVDMLSEVLDNMIREQEVSMENKSQHRGRFAS